MKKLFVDKKEIAASIIDKIINDEEIQLVLVIPKNAILKESSSNFHLIRREAEAAGKTVYIESVDEEVLALAKASSLEATHPLFHDSHAVSDIVLREDIPHGVIPVATQEKKRGKATRAHTTLTPEVDDGEEQPRVYLVQKKITESATVEEQEGVLEEHYRKRYEYKEEDIPRKKGRWGKRFLIAGLLVLVLILGGMWITSTLFAHARIAIVMKKSPWLYENTFMVDASATALMVAQAVIPGELFAQDKNITQLFPATGPTTHVQQKARGVVTIYNAYDARPQILVATTRFQTPDGKVFRLLDQVVVPPGTVSGGVITPQSIDAQVIADVAGPESNIGPVQHLSIPGFAGTPRFKGFYGALKQATEGGFSGEKATVTKSDSAAAQTKTTQLLKDAMRSVLVNNHPADLKVLDGASDAQVTKVVINKDADAQGNFSVFAEGTLKALAFKEEDVKLFLAALSLQDRPGTELGGLELQYTQAKSDIAHGTMTISLKAQGTVKQSLSLDNLKNNIAGKKVSDVKAVIATVPGLSDAKISLWPFWLQSLPDEPQKIQIDAQ